MMRLALITSLVLVAVPARGEGLVADLSNLTTALLGVSVFILAAGVLWNLGARYLDEETRRVTEAETPG